MSELTDPTDLPIFSQPGTAAALPAAGPGVHRLAGPVGSRRPRPLRLAATPPADPTVPATDPPDPDPMSAPGSGGIDWRLVGMLRAQASDQLTSALDSNRSLDRDAERALGRSIIDELLRTTGQDRIHDGQRAWSWDEQQALAEAVFNALFGLGRLQPLVDDVDLENILVDGAENVWVETSDGHLQRRDPVADSDQELIDFVAFVGTRSEVNARSFSPANPHLHMRLDGGARLAASAWVTPRPSIVIRRHRLVHITLDDLVARSMISEVQASFLKAAVLARKSIVVAGPQGAGKTTLVRALCAAIPRWEIIGTFESEYELHLRELGAHAVVFEWEARPGSGEIGPDGRQAGEITLMDLLFNSFRFNLSRQIVGEIRGPEVWALIKAMESSAGSISTTHAADATNAIGKLVTCAMEFGPQVTRQLATEKLVNMLDLVVQVRLETSPVGDGQFRRSRWVSEIVHVAPGEALKGYSTTHVFRPNPDGGPALPGTLPDELRDLERHGFDLTGYLNEHGTEEPRP